MCRALHQETTGHVVNRQLCGPLAPGMPPTHIRALLTVATFVTGVNLCLARLAREAVIAHAERGALLILDLYAVPAALKRDALSTLHSSEAGRRAAQAPGMRGARGAPSPARVAGVLALRQRERHLPAVRERNLTGHFLGVRQVALVALDAGLARLWRHCGLPLGRKAHPGKARSAGVIRKLCAGRAERQKHGRARRP